MAAAALVDRSDSLTDAQIDAAITNLCRCGIYPRLRESIRRAVRIKTGQETAAGAPPPAIAPEEAARAVPALRAEPRRRRGEPRGRLIPVDRLTRRFSRRSSNFRAQAVR